MTFRTFAPVAALAAGVILAFPALAGTAYGDAFFVRHGGAGAQMLQDRADCARQSQSLGDNEQQYTDPQYGALKAMGDALDEDALHEGGLHKRLERAVFENCMKKLGWTPLSPDPGDARAIGKASARHPEALDAWLKAHEPPPAPPAPPPTAPKAAPAPDATWAKTYTPSGVTAPPPTATPPATSAAAVSPKP